MTADKKAKEAWEGANLFNKGDILKRIAEAIESYTDEQVKEAWKTAHAQYQFDLKMETAKLNTQVEVLRTVLKPFAEYAS